MRDLTARLVEIATTVGGGFVGSSEDRRFADVSLVTTQPPPSTGPTFYPEDRTVVTRHVAELGWLFGQMVGAFADEPGYGTWKEELFGRLGNAANWYLAHNPDSTAREVCLAVCLESLVIADEFRAGEPLPEPLVVIDNRVADDERDPLDGSRPSDASSVRAALANRGVNV